MKKAWHYWTLLFIVITSCTQPTENKEQSLTGDWKFSRSPKPIESTMPSWLPATVPGTVQTDLLSLDKIPDPFTGTHENDIQWISENNWNYKKEFAFDVQNKSKRVLRFEGLDTYATVILNDSIILSTNNAFRTWETEVTHLLKEENTLQVLFQSPDTLEQKAANILPYTLPEAPRVFTRKAQFQYGWDWGPTIKTMGITGDVSIISYEGTRLTESYIETKTLTKEEATLQAHITADHINTEEISLVITNQETRQKIRKMVTPSVGLQTHTIPITIPNPELWWTHNLGDPYLYHFTIELQKKGVTIATQEKQVGLRTIELVTEKDEVGESFYFKLNGEAVYMKGANYIPQNIFLPEVEKEDRIQLLDDVVAANMNMLRVWGGGIYENTDFYKLCDERGILIWQDFMFACAMYPGDEAFLNNVKQEAVESVKRLRQHPSIALWCGNNENSEGWHRWGWQTDKTEEQKKEIWGNYQKVFNEILPKVVDSLQPSVSYWESSPKYGRGDKRYQFEGDAHDWWVWHDGYPFEHFEEEVPRFMSEFGFQSFPSYEAIRYFAEQDSIDLNHPSFETHQKHSRGFSLIKEYMERDFPVPTNGEDYVYVSQLVQAHGITKGIHAHRRAKPYNMGTLYWQLNDCWPVVSWSSIDGLGNWKALHYKAKKAFENILLSTEEKEDTLHIYIVSDELKSEHGTLTALFMTTDGEVIKERSTPMVAIPNSSTSLFKIPLTEPSLDRNKTFVDIRFRESAFQHYFTSPKDLILLKQNIAREFTKTKKGFKLTLTSSVLQKDVFLIADSKGKWSDNFFDLLPEETKEVTFVTDNPEATLLEIKTLNKLLVD